MHSCVMARICRKGTWSEPTRKWAHLLMDNSSKISSSCMISTKWGWEPEVERELWLGEVVEIGKNEGKSSKEQQTKAAKAN